MSSLDRNDMNPLNRSTKSKTNSCPDCDFVTVDPGSLTRHRKRIHGYIPKMRRSRQPKPQPDAAGAELPPKPLALRFSPYSAATHQHFELSPHCDSRPSTSATPPAIADMLSEAPLNDRSGSPSTSQPQPRSGSHSPSTMAGSSYSFITSGRLLRPRSPAAETTKVLPLHPPSPRIDPALLHAGPPRTIVPSRS